MSLKLFYKNMNSFLNNLISIPKARVVKKIFFVGLLNFVNLNAQNSFELFPSGLNILPLKANMQEARLGILYFPDNAHLKVDIGNSSDIFCYNFDGNKFSMGIEFMAYGLSTNYQGRRLQIDALDGFFGGNASISIPYENHRLLMRFRIIHNSAHFVDGHYDFEKNIWKNNINPIPFTQDFGELTALYKIQNYLSTLNLYSSLGYSSLVRPALIQKWWANFGTEYYYQIEDSFFNQPINLFLALQLKAAGMPKYKLNYNTMLGIKFGKVDEKGVVFYFDYYIGNNYFSEYYYNRIKKFGIGFQVDSL